MSILEKNRVLELVKEFRDVYHDMDKRPKLIKESLGAYRKDGVLKFEHYFLYAMIRGVDPLKGVKNNSDALRLARYFRTSLRWYNDVFKSLDDEEFKLFSDKYKEIMEGINK